MTQGTEIYCMNKQTRTQSEVIVGCAVVREL